MLGSQICVGKSRSIGLICSPESRDEGAAKGGSAGSIHLMPRQIVLGLPSILNGRAIIWAGAYS